MRTRQTNLTYPTLGIVIILCAVVTFMHNHAQRAGRVDIFTTKLRALVIAPTVGVEESGVSFTTASITGTLRAAKTARENAFLRAKLQRIIVENQLLRQQIIADDEVRKALHSPAPLMPNLIVGNVVALKPSPVRDNALVAVESGTLLHERQVVLGPSGELVGQVVDTDHTIADVMLVTDSLSSVGARVVPNGRTAPAKVIVGICQGDRSSTLAMIDLPDDCDIRVGDTVTTSGLGGVYPANLPLGVVKSVRLDAARSMMTAVVEPATDVNNLQEVFLLP